MASFLRLLKKSGPPLRPGCRRGSSPRSRACHRRHPFNVKGGGDSLLDEPGHDHVPSGATIPTRSFDGQERMVVRLAEVSAIERLPQRRGLRPSREADHLRSAGGLAVRPVGDAPGGRHDGEPEDHDGQVVPGLATATSSLVVSTRATRLQFAHHLVRLRERAGLSQGAG